MPKHVLVDDQQRLNLAPFRPDITVLVDWAENTNLLTYLLTYLALFAEEDRRPPPMIIMGPQNQTLEVKEVAMLPCQAKGNPPPVIRWYKDGRPLIGTDPRITILNSGTLQISGKQGAWGWW